MSDLIRQVTKDLVFFFSNEPFNYLIALYLLIIAINVIYNLGGVKRFK